MRRNGGLLRGAQAGQVAELQQRIAVSGDPVEIVQLAARLRRLLMEGAGDVVAALTDAAATEPEVARAYRDGMERSRAGVRRIVERLNELGALRSDLDVERAADSAYTMLHHDIWRRLVGERGWSPDASRGPEVHPSRYHDGR